MAKHKNTHTDTEPVKVFFKPTAEEEKAREVFYKNLTLMRDLKTQQFPHFAGQYGQRSWLSYIDDSERVLNGYVESREAQGKEEWQANLMDNITLQKCRAIAAGVGLRVPKMNFDATNSKGVRSLVRAEILKNITTQTFEDQNPSLHNFLEVWQLICHGTIFEYEGFQTGGAKVRRVKSFDSVTGDIEIEEKFVKFDGKPISVILNPQDFLWWDMKIRDVQDQKRVAWIQKYGKKDLEIEFSKHKNFKYIMDKSSVVKNQLQDTLYYQKWSDGLREENDFEVARLYDKEEDIYEVWINGVPIIRTPLLWGGDKKVYPFAKQINQAFANSNWFVGMSWPAILESYQDHKNTHINTLIDKTYRTLETPMLIGLGNKDLFDVEDQLVNQDNRYYVPDVNQVKPYPIAGVNQGELAMLEVLNQGIELSSIDKSQQGIASATQKTARQSLIDDARAQELKGPLYLSLEDLWLQKTKLRIEIVLTHYLKDKAVRVDTKGQIVSVKDYTFGNGERGILDIHVAKSKAGLLPIADVEAREDAAEEQGLALKVISVLISWLDEWQYEIQIVPQSFHSQERLAKEEELTSEIQQIAILDPAFIASNKDKYVDRILELHGRHRDQYNPPAEVAAPTEGSLLGLDQQENVTPTTPDTSLEGRI